METDTLYIFRKYTMQHQQLSIDVWVADTTKLEFHMNDNLEYVYGNKFFCILCSVCCSILSGSDNSVVIIPKLKPSSPSKIWNEHHSEHRDIFFTSKSLQISLKEAIEMYQKTCKHNQNYRKIMIDVNKWDIASLYNQELDKQCCEYRNSSVSKLHFSAKRNKLLLTGNKEIFELLMVIIYKYFHDVYKDSFINGFPHLHLADYVAGNEKERRIDFTLSCYQV